MAWALKHAPVPDAPAHLVLIGLADHAASDGSGAYPSKTTLAEYARCSVRTVHNKLRALEGLGTIRRGDQRLVAHLRADRRPTVYDLPIYGVQQVHPAHGVQQVHPVGGHGVNDQVGRGEQPGSHGVNAVADKPSMNLPEPSNTSSPAAPTTPTVMSDADLLDAGFEAFWTVYPRKVGKTAARKAFEAAVRRTAKETRQTVDLAVIIGGAERMAADPNLPGKEFIPHAATWLNQGRWLDEPYPARGAQASTTDARVTEAAALAALPRSSSPTSTSSALCRRASTMRLQ